MSKLKDLLGMDDEGGEDKSSAKGGKKRGRKGSGKGRGKGKMLRK